MKKLFIFFIRLYQIFISPFSRGSCRFVPTCSHYSIQAIERFGIAKGTALTFKRVLRCNPFNPGGYDPVPEIEKKP